MPFTRSNPATDSTIKLTGTIDRTTARRLDTVMRDIALGAAPVVVIDIADVDEVNGALLGVLVRATRWVGWRNGRIVIVCPGDDLRRGLEVAGLDHLAEVHASWPQVTAEPPAPLRRGTAARP